MEKLKKRVFVGNLPSGVTESKVRKKFGKFGIVTNIEIKTNNDVAVQSCYAFLDLETDTTHLDSCFENLPKENWKGHSIKLEFAKESFLSRLQKERHEVKAKSSQETTTKNEHAAKSYDFSNSSSRQIPTSNKRRFDNDNCSIEIKPDAIDFAHQKGVNHTSRPSEGSEAKGLLQKFESFSDVWKDPPTFSDQKKPRNNDNAKFDSFEIVSQNREQSKIDCFSSKSKSNLVNNKTNTSEEKRLKSMQERKQTFLQQKEAVKLALAAVDSKVTTNNKIIFDDDLDEETGFSNNLEQLDKSQKASLKGRHGPQLFEDDGVEEEQNYDFTIRKQFEGKKGQKLLDLQSRYANDKRFTLDDRFYETDDSTDNEVDGPPKEGSIEEERRKQLEILQSIVGSSLPHSREDKKVKTCNVDNMIVHYDPTIDDHAKYEIKHEKPKKVAASFNTRQERRLEEKREKRKQNKDWRADLPTVSREKFYQVSDNLKESLKSDGKSFSLLETFGSIEEKKESSNKEDTGTYNSVTTNRTMPHNLSSNPFKWDSSDSEDEAEDTSAIPVSSLPQNQSALEAPVKARGIWRESFFLRANDERLSEGLKFFSQGENLNEDFSQRRRQVQRIVSAKIRKNTLKSTSFRLGGGGRKSKKFMGKNK